MDIKSSDVLVDDDKRLWIVDYDLSEILDEVENGEVVLVSGFRGTKGFTAQEVGRKDYDPLLADVWAAGNIVDELYSNCTDNTADLDFLLRLGKKLMRKIPEKRLLLQDALKLVEEHKRGSGTP